MPYLSGIIKYNAVAKIVGKGSAPITDDMAIGFRYLRADLPAAALGIDLLFLCLRHLKEFILSGVVNGVLVALLGNQQPLVTSIVEANDVIVVEMTVLIGIRTFICGKEIAVIAIQSTWSSHPNESPAVLNQRTDVVVG